MSRGLSAIAEFLVSNIEKLRLKYIKLLVDIYSGRNLGVVLLFFVVGKNELERCDQLSLFSSRSSRCRIDVLVENDNNFGDIFNTLLYGLEFQIAFHLVQILFLRVERASENEMEFTCVEPSVFTTPKFFSMSFVTVLDSLVWHYRKNRAISDQGWHRAT